MDREELQDRLRGAGDPLILLAELLAQAPVAFQLYSSEGRSLLVNEAFLELFGVAPPPEYNVLEDEIAARNGVLSLIRRAFRGETVQTPAVWYDPRELHQVHVADGRRLSMSARFVPLLRDPAGRVTHVGVFFRKAPPELLDSEAPEEMQALRRAQWALAASESKYRSIVETAREGVWTFDEQGRTTFANPMLTELLGYTERELLGRALSEFALPEERQELGERLEEGRAGRLARFDVRLRRKDGVALIANLSIGPLRGPTEDYDGVLAMVTDVTARRRWTQEREELLERERSTRESLQLVMDVIPQRLFWKDRAFRFLGCNRVFAQDAGLEHPEELIGRTDFDLGWASSAPLYRADDEQVIQSEKAKLDYEEPQVLGDGSLRCLRTSKIPLRDRDGRVIGLFGSYEDITKRRRADEALELLAEAGTAMGSSLELREGMQALTRVLVPRLGDYCAVLLGAAPRDLALVAEERGKRWPERSPSFDAEELFRTGAPRLVQDPDARTRSLMVAPLTGREGPLGVLLLSSGKTRRRLDEEDLRLAVELSRRAAVAIENARLYSEAKAAIRLRDEFLSVASHDLKTPLTPLLLKLQALERLALRQGELQSEELLEKTGIALRQVRKLSQLVAELLDVARLESGRLPLNLEHVDAREAALGVVEQLQAQARQAGSVVSVVAPHPVVGFWDHLQLELVLMNLLSNAVKYGAGQPIEVQVDHDGADAVLTVRDQGIGVPRHEVDRIFGRFERAVSGRHYGGLGLGLYITAQIVERLGGRVSVESEIGHGATFTVRLPLEGPSRPEDLSLRAAAWTEEAALHPH